MEDLSSVAELAKRRPLDSALDRIFEITEIDSDCNLSETLANKFGLSQENHQTVVCIRNRFSFEQAWFNPLRRRKPEAFSNVAEMDPTENGKNCDFCGFEELTPSDAFGRIQNDSVTTASNLFKSCAPCHGLVLFKHHQPLEFCETHLRDLMFCTQKWFDKMTESNPEATFPFFFWNCLSRAGASQFHGHVQVMLTPIPFPCYSIAETTRTSYSRTYPDRSYLDDLFLAYERVSLLSTIQKNEEKCVVYPSLTPWKDLEVVIWTTSIVDSVFHETFFTIMKTLMEAFGMQTFNVGIQKNVLSSQNGPVLNWMARICSRGNVNSRSSDFGGLEVFGGASIGLTDPFEIHKRLRNELFCSS